MCEVFLNNSFKSYKNIFDFRFVFKWIELNVFGEVINKDDVVFKTIVW